MERFGLFKNFKNLTKIKKAQTQKKGHFLWNALGFWFSNIYPYKDQKSPKKYKPKTILERNLGFSKFLKFLQLDQKAQKSPSPKKPRPFWNVLGYFKKFNKDQKSPSPKKPRPLFWNVLGFCFSDTKRPKKSKPDPILERFGLFEASISPGTFREYLGTFQDAPGTFTSTENNLYTAFWI